MKKKQMALLIVASSLVSQVFAMGGSLVSRDGNPVLDRSGGDCATRFQDTSLKQNSPANRTNSNLGS